MQTQRLNMILKHIDAKTVADIGTDHGYIPVELARRGARVIATDVRSGPLDAARRRISHTDCGGRIELRLGNGLSPIAPSECENIVIAGMGGELICKILADGEETARSCAKLLLQPMNSQDMLREFLSENGYEIICEDIGCEGFKVYNLMVVKNGVGYAYKDKFDLHLPRYLYRHENFPALLRKKNREFTKILTGLKNAAQRDEERIAEYASLLEQTSELMQRFERNNI